ncbi:hypothetical protein J4218_03700 [Candidatus Pacearchaeota archaeon]|nr:hypothetical protein [Candidatus Pacearchaeota archaeon]
MKGDFGLTNSELKLFKSLNTPAKIQDFINKIPINFEESGDSCYSPRMVLKNNRCHCIEGAILAALILRVNGYAPLLVDLTANDKDFDHVVAVFEKDGKWGAISKTNHYSLRYREPVYDSLKELVMSYFHEYFNDKGKKTLRSYSNFVDLSMFDHENWMTTDEEVWQIPEYLAEVEHFPILTKSQISCLRNADEIEIQAGKIVEYKSDKIKENF